MGKHVKYELALSAAGIERRIEEGDSVESLARRYGVGPRPIERALKELGLETFQQRFQCLSAKDKKHRSEKA